MAMRLYGEQFRTDRAIQYKYSWIDLLITWSSITSTIELHRHLLDTLYAKWHVQKVSKIRHAGGDDDDDLEDWEIALIVLGVLLALALLFCCCFCFCCGYEILKFWFIWIKKTLFDLQAIKVGLLWHRCQRKRLSPVRSWVRFSLRIQDRGC